MISNEKLIGRICQRIDRDLGDGNTAAKLTRFEEVILNQTVQPQARTNSADRKVPSGKLLLFAAILLCAIIPTAIVIGFAHETPLRLTVDNHPIDGNSILTFQTGMDTKTIQFSNNSSIELLQSTVATVQKATDDEVVVALTDGELFLDVEGKESERWVVDMGDYRVSVLGTRFFVKWEKQGALLDVRVEKGAVLVEGQFAGKVGIAVHRDTHLRLDTETGFSAMNNMSSSFYDASSPSLLRNENELQTAWNERMGTATALLSQNTNRPDSASNNALDAKLAGDSSSQADHNTHIGSNPEGAGRKYPNSSDPQRRKEKNSKITATAPDHSHPLDAVIGESAHDWKTLLAQGDFRGAIAAAEDVGFSNVIEDAPLDQLWQLMNAARKSGRDELAKRILLTCRNRFATSRKAQLAAFVLGKVHYYGMSDPSSAAKWFEAYLNEAPTGPLAEEALGRLIAIQAERGKTAEAKSLAQKYLNRHPTGAFAKTCHELIEK